MVAAEDLQNAVKQADGTVDIHIPASKQGPIKIVKNCIYRKRSSVTETIKHAIHNKSKVRILKL
jgi:hypothetical protein